MKRLIAFIASAALLSGCIGPLILPDALEPAALCRVPVHQVFVGADGWTPVQAGDNFLMPAIDGSEWAGHTDPTQVVYGDDSVPPVVQAPC